MALLCMSRPAGDCVVETQSDWGYSLGVAEWKGATGEHGTLADQDVRALQPGVSCACIVRLRAELGCVTT